MMNDLSSSSVLGKVRNFVSSLIPALLALMVVCSFTLSIYAVVRTGKTSKEVAELSQSVATLMEDQQKSFRDMSLTLDAIEGHVAFMEKYIGDHATFFYGNDRVTVKNRK